MSKSAVVTGGAGFLGSHLCTSLVEDGWYVIAIDTLRTSRHTNLRHLMSSPAFELRVWDVTQPFVTVRKVDVVYHLASIPSPQNYRTNPIPTLRAGSHGTENALLAARANSAVMVLASTSEVYGQPEVHPQVESYNGNVNPVGPRSMYDESKRYAEALVKAYETQYKVDARIARIFNTYGPHMSPFDGRVVSTFIRQALTGNPITIQGDGTQTRSLCYVSDMVRGLRALAESGSSSDPVNLGNPTEITIGYLARKIQMLTESKSQIAYVEEAPDDPVRRKPDITRAQETLGWTPTVGLDEGINSTIEWFRTLEENYAG